MKHLLVSRDGKALVAPPTWLRAAKLASGRWISAKDAVIEIDFVDGPDGVQEIGRRVVPKPAA